MLTYTVVAKVESKVKEPNELNLISLLTVWLPSPLVIGIMFEIPRSRPTTSGKLYDVSSVCCNSLNTENVLSSIAKKT